jgi:hypothetical protein
MYRDACTVLTISEYLRVPVHRRLRPGARSGVQRARPNLDLARSRASSGASTGPLTILFVGKPRAQGGAAS